MRGTRCIAVDHESCRGSAENSTLLSTIAVLDVVGMMQATSSRVEWMPYAVEGYLFVGFVFGCLATDCQR